MTETTRACIRGCATYREHYADCEGNPCTGCLPRRAERGYLCWTCYRRFELMLTDAPTVYRWLTGNLSRHSSSLPTDVFVTAGKGAAPPIPIHDGIYDTRQLLADRLSIWVDHFAEDVKVAKPGRSTVEADSAFLLRWLTSVVACEWIGDWWDELAEVYVDAHALAPWRPAVRRIPSVPCPGCGETNLVIFGGETDVTCGSCRIMMTEDRFELWSRVLKSEVVNA